ncbi:DUF3784 domain-containing protein [Algoriphagus vanfongensis]|uniref:DUF3784 domain-containing protein n=1 Tax=Algoriphagus vanfongensis TaxID=426371 RepID=UPI0003FC4720|nr:DUF3784 domain-containing protein [Algoriphagus vanfongensis]
MAPLIIGILFISLGIAMRYFPGLLAGFNQMSQSEKENALKNGLPTFVSIALFVMGILSIIGYFAAIWFDNRTLLLLGTFASIIGVIVIVFFGNLLKNR